MKFKYLSFGLWVFSLSACSLFNKPAESLEKEEYKEEFLNHKIMEFDEDDLSSSLRISNGYSNGGMFLSTWTNDNVIFNNGFAELSLVDKNDINYGAEIRTNQGYLYGYFGTRMKTFKCDGTVQSFFTYNGGAYDHDEIDIEFLGKDTTKVQFNYYHDGVGGHEYVYDLGFDSSLDFHDYGFLWQESAIYWFVDFKCVYSCVASLDQWGFLFANVWAGNNDKTTSWLKAFNGAPTKLTTYYDYFTYKAL